MGTIVVVSDTWDNIPEVEIVSGMNAPDDGNKLNLRDVQRGWQMPFEDHVCYRRSNDPGRPGSGLTPWSCFTRSISGSETVSLS